MLDLILLRHAHADAAMTGQADLDRTLSAVGQAEAEAAGRWLLDHALVPDRVLCSPAVRTRQTLEAVLAQTGYVEQRVEGRIYDAAPGGLISVLEEHRDVRRLLLVGHNPGLEQVVALLHSGRSGEYRGMPPAGIAVLRLPPDALLEPGVADLTQFWWP